VVPDPYRTGSVAPSASGRPGVAVLGVGAIAALHATALREAGARLFAVFGPDASRASDFAAVHGFESVAPTAEACITADGVEVVVVASPNPVHAAQARLSLEAGRHVLGEIPLALSLAEGEALVGLAEERGLRLGVCHTLRFWEPYQAVIGAIAASGARPTHVLARYLLDRRRAVGWTGRPRRWTDDLLWHHGGHVIDIALVLLGAAGVEVTAAVGPPLGRDEGVAEASASPGGGDLPLDYAITLRVPTGAVATIGLSYRSRSPVTDVVVITDRETWEVRGAQARDSGTVICELEPEEAQRRAVAAQDTAFLDAVRHGTPFAADARSVLPTLRVQQAVADVFLAMARPGPS
jgi:2-hydroxy-4-carboxymuconate semialdehyde hemiacetal dehydrogenase